VDLPVSSPVLSDKFHIGLNQVRRQPYIHREQVKEKSLFHDLIMEEQPTEESLSRRQEL